MEYSISHVILIDILFGTYYWMQPLHRFHIIPIAFKHQCAARVVGDLSTLRTLSKLCERHARTCTYSTCVEIHHYSTAHCIQLYHWTTVGRTSFARNLRTNKYFTRLKPQFGIARFEYVIYLLENRFPFYSKILFF